MRKLLLPAIGLLCSAQAAAMTVSISELPNDIRNCFESGQCFVIDDGDEITVTSLSTIMETPETAAFEYMQSNGTSVVHRRLMRYVLLSPPGTVNGVAWLSAQNSYNIAASDAHSFTMYYPSFWSSTAATQTFWLNDNDLADGSAFIRADFDGWTTHVSGDMDIGFDSIISLCLAEGCGAMWTLNLSHMNFTNGQFTFNPGDSQGLLYEYRDWDCSAGYFHQGDCAYSDAANAYSLYVHAVPLPASALLFTSGLVGGALSLRRKKATTA